MNTIYYSIIFENDKNNFFPFALAKLDENFIVSPIDPDDFRSFPTFEEAKFFITELQKPNYCKLFGLNYSLQELDQFSEEWKKLFEKWFNQF